MARVQNSFDFGPVPPRAKRLPDQFTGSNLFIAARPDAAAATAAQAVAREIRDQYRIGRQPLSIQRLHVSLISLGRHADVPESVVYHAREALDGLQLDPFEIAFDRIVSFRSDASFPVVLCAQQQDPALKAAVAQLAGRLAGLGVDFGWNPDFIAHMTLVYHTAPVTPERLAAPIRWTVDVFWLIRSLIGAGSYTFLWPPQGGWDAA
jgi:2'-5' RNA ligase